MTVLAYARVADLAVTCPTVHPAEATVGAIRAFFLDDHKHMALLVDGNRLVATVERDDLSPELCDDRPACLAGTLAGRTLDPDVPVETAFTSMRANRRRRLAVTDVDGSLVGLLCLKTRRDGFCSDADVTSRRLASVA
jgi:CBS domain